MRSAIRDGVGYVVQEAGEWCVRGLTGRVRVGGSGWMGLSGKHGSLGQGNLVGVRGMCLFVCAVGEGGIRGWYVVHEDDCGDGGEVLRLHGIVIRKSFGENPAELPRKPTHLP